MSFAKSKTKRFNDVISCAPPPGHYDPKLMKNIHGAYIEKEKRFKDSLMCENGDVSVCSIASYGSLETLTPRKALFLGESAKKPAMEKARTRHPSAADLAKQRDMEAEMKRMMLERMMLDRSLHSKEDELAKLDGRLQQVQKDKTALEANMASLKKEVIALRKSNDLLKQHLQEDIRKAVADAKRPLLDEQEKLRAELSVKESSLKVMLTDLEQSQSELVKLQEVKEKELQADIQRATEDTKQTFQAEQAQLKAEYEEQYSQMKGVLTKLEDDLETRKMEQQALEDNKKALFQQVNDLKETIVKLNTEKFDDNNLIRHLKGEVFAMKDATLDKEEQIQYKEEEIKKQEGQIQHLIQQEKQLNDNMEKLTTKCTELEKDLVTMETVSKQKEETLQTDLSTLQISYDESLTYCDSLKQNNAKLAFNLAAEQDSRRNLKICVNGLEESRDNLSLQVQNTELQLNLLQQQNMELQNEIQSINWDKGMLEGRICEMEAHQTQMQVAQDDLEAQYEGRVKDVQGQILILRDTVDNKQYELNEVISLNTKLQQKLQEIQNEFSIETQKNRTREFLLQEQEKENCRELERAQKSEKEMRCRLETASRESIKLENELYEIQQQHHCLLENHQHQIPEMRDKLRRSSLSAAESRQQVTQLEHHMDEKNEALAEKDDNIKKLEKLLDRKNAELLKMSKQVPAESKDNEWQQKYELLYQKVLPFQEQLEAFEAERCALLGISQNAQHEVEKLSREYAKLLGHQNQKQKIHHILKIKEENNSLKLEVTKLRDQTARQKRQLNKLEDQAKSAGGKMKFDASKAFSHTKENKIPPKSPLRDGNRQ